MVAFDSCQFIINFQKNKLLRMDIAALCQKRIAWKGTLNAEQLAAFEAEKTAWTNEETKAERMAEFAATFGSSDTDADGRLNRAEFEDFMTKLGQNSAARNVPFQPHSDYSDEEKDGVFAIFNAKSEGDGVTSEDFFGTMMEINAKMRELQGN